MEQYEPIQEVIRQRMIETYFLTTVCVAPFLIVLSMSLHEARRKLVKFLGIAVLASSATSTIVSFSDYLVWSDVNSRVTGMALDAVAGFKFDTIETSSGRVFVKELHTAGPNDPIPVEGVLSEDGPSGSQPTITHLQLASHYVRTAQERTVGLVPSLSAIIAISYLLLFAAACAKLLSSPKSV